MSRTLALDRVLSPVEPGALFQRLVSDSGLFCSEEIEAYRSTARPLQPVIFELGGPNTWWKTPSDHRFPWVCVKLANNVTWLKCINQKSFAESVKRRIFTVFRESGAFCR
jgi:hypothetical protein